VEVDVNVHQETLEGLDLIYGDEDTREGAAQRVVQVARDAYTDGLDLARRCAAQAVRRFAALEAEARPDEIEMQISIKVDAGVAALVKSGAEAQLQITFRWQASGAAGDPTPDPEGNAS
jgi:hypothetical protein